MKKTPENVASSKAKFEEKSTGNYSLKIILIIDIIFLIHWIFELSFTFILFSIFIVFMFFQILLNFYYRLKGTPWKYHYLV